MDIYIIRLERLGFGVSEAIKTCIDMVERFGFDGLDEYITDLESDCYVD